MDSSLGAYTNAECGRFIFESLKWSEYWEFGLNNSNFYSQISFSGTITSGLMAQTFEGNSGALLSTECCYFQSNAVSTRRHVCNALVKHLRFCVCVQYCCPDAFENSQSLHYWCLFTYPLQNRNRKPQANNYLANSGTHTIFNLPLAGQLGSWPMKNIWPEEGCDLQLCSMYEAYKIYAGHWQDPINEQSFASKPHRLCPTDKRSVLVTWLPILKCPKNITQFTEVEVLEGTSKLAQL